MVRHGQSIWNHDSKFTGWTDIPLTKKGLDEAKQISKFLIQNKIQPNVYFTSVLKRCINTTHVIRDLVDSKFKTKSDIYTSWRLNEKHYGCLEGVPRDEIRGSFGKKFTSMMRNNFYMKPPVIEENELPKKCNQYPIFRNCYYESIKYGESKENVLSRLLPYYENDILYSFQLNQIPMIVTHKHCVRVLMKHLLKISDQDFENFTIPSDHLVEIDIDDNRNLVDYKYIRYI